MWLCSGCGLGCASGVGDGDSHVCSGVCVRDGEHIGAIERISGLGELLGGLVHPLMDVVRSQEPLVTHCCVFTALHCFVSCCTSVLRTRDSQLCLSHLNREGVTSHAWEAIRP